MLRREFYDRKDTGAVGFFDVSNFFASCAHDTVGSLLDHGPGLRRARSRC